jgi:hypothetical protein
MSNGITGLGRVLSLALFLALAVPGLALGDDNAEGLPVVPFTVVNNTGSTRHCMFTLKESLQKKPKPSRRVAGSMFPISTEI